MNTENSKRALINEWNSKRARWERKYFIKFNVKNCRCSTWIDFPVSYNYRSDSFMPWKFGSTTIIILNIIPTPGYKRPKKSRPKIILHFQFSWSLYNPWTFFMLLLDFTTIIIPVHSFSLSSAIFFLDSYVGFFPTRVNWLYFCTSLLLGMVLVPTAKWNRYVHSSAIHKIRASANNKNTVHSHAQEE